MSKWRTELRLKTSVAEKVLRDRDMIDLKPEPRDKKCHNMDSSVFPSILLELLAFAGRGFTINRETEDVFHDLAVILNLLHETSTTILNSARPVPMSVMEAVYLCKRRQDSLVQNMEKAEVRIGRCSRLQTFRRFRTASSRSLPIAYGAFRAAVLLLSDVTVSSMTQQILQRQTELQSQNVMITAMIQDIIPGRGMLSESTRIMDKGIERINEDHAEFYFDDIDEGFQDAVDERQLVSDMHRLQVQYPDQTLFAAVLCPILQEVPKRLPVRCKLDTGSDVNIIDTHLVRNSELQQLITDIPITERRQIKGIMGFSWVPTKRITLNFYLINSLRMRSAEFFLCEGADLDVLISNNYLAAIREEEGSRAGRMLMLTEVPLTAEQRAVQQALVTNRNASSLDYARSRDRRLALERARQRGQILPSPPASVPGRAWTIESNGTSARAIIAGPSPDTSSQSSVSTTRYQGNEPTREVPEVPVTHAAISDVTTHSRGEGGISNATSARAEAPVPRQT